MTNTIEVLDDAALATATGGGAPAPGTPLDQVMIGQGDLWGGGGVFAHGHARGTTIYIIGPDGAMAGGMTNLRR